MALPSPFDLLEWSYEVSPATVVETGREISFRRADPTAADAYILSLRMYISNREIVMAYVSLHRTQLLDNQYEIVPTYLRNLLFDCQRQISEKFLDRSNKKPWTT